MTCEPTPICIDVPNAALRYGDKEVHLRPMWLRLLVELVRAPDKIVLHNRLIECLWDDEPEDARMNLRMQLCILRRALKAAGVPPIIETIWAQGYRIDPTVTIRQPSRDVTIPSDLVTALRRLLRDAPASAAADRLLVVVGA